MRKFVLVSLLSMAILSFSVVKVWFSWEGYDEFKAYLEEIAREKGVNVKVEYVRKIDEKLFVLMKAGRLYLPDIIMIKNDKLFIFKDLFEDLSSLVSKGELLEKSVDAFKVRGRILALPFYFDVEGVIIYNKDIFADPGKVSFEKLVKLSKKSDTMYSFLVPIYGTYYFQIFQRAFGKEKVDLNFDDEATLKAFEFLKRLKSELPNIPEDRRGLVSAFMRKEAPLIMFGGFMIPKFISKGINVGIVLPPVFEESGRVLSANLDFKGFAVTKGNLRDEVKVILRILQSYELQKNFCKKFYKFPANEKAFEDLKNYSEIFKRMYVYYIHGYPTPGFEKVNVYYEAVTTALKALIKGEKDPERLAGIAEEVVKSWK